jgi:hypothetical protein
MEVGGWLMQAEARMLWLAIPASLVMQHASCFCATNMPTFFSYLQRDYLQAQLSHPKKRNRGSISR